MRRDKGNAGCLIHECKNRFDALIRFSAIERYGTECIRVSKSSSTYLLGRAILFLIAALGTVCSSSAQTNHASWNSLSELQAGQKIEVVDMGSKKHNGVFANVSDSAITYTDQTGEHAIPKQDVRSVKVGGNLRRLRNVLIGAGVGAGAGAGLTAAGWENSGFLGGKADGAKVGAAIGGVGGAIFGAFFPSHRLIYRAISH
jgi:hypothetical protein